MKKLKMMPNQLGKPCYRKDSDEVQNGLNLWKDHNINHKVKVNKTMHYWEVKSACTAL